MRQTKPLSRQGRRVLYYPDINHSEMDKFLVLRGLSRSKSCWVHLGVIAAQHESPCVFWRPLPA
jgi:hypothetical protein